jgi:hypothetical protein
MKILAIKNILLLMMTGMFLSFTGRNTSYQTECISTNTDGYITIKIWDIKKGSKYKSEQARKDAVHALLFSGFSGNNNCSTQLPLLNKTEEQENFKKIETTFFASRGQWSKFTRSSDTETTLAENMGPKSWKVYEISISSNELRKYLEELNIIKSLNNGF